MTLQFDPLRLPEHCETLREQVRAFLQAEILAGTFDPDDPAVGNANSPLFARRLAEQGWIGMTWPRRYGGQERSALERYVVTEELRAVNAPVKHFLVADRQSGPTLIRYADQAIKDAILPRITTGELCFCVGMSEPDSGSDLFAARARATAVPGGWRLQGTKIWTSMAHEADYMIGLFRTSAPTAENRRHGLTSLLIDMRSAGISCHPIRQLAGVRDFNEVVFEDVFVPEAHLIGEVDGAWKQATTELAYERSGPERFLETIGCLQALVDVLDEGADARVRVGLGRELAQLHVLRRMSVSVAGMLEVGKEPVVEAAIIKDQATLWEQALPHRVRELAALLEPEVAGMQRLERHLERCFHIAPKLTIQGGTTEILRGIIARGLGLR